MRLLFISEQKAISFGLLEFLNGVAESFGNEPALIPLNEVDGAIFSCEAHFPEEPAHAELVEPLLIMEAGVAEFEQLVHEAWVVGFIISVFGSHHEAHSGYSPDPGDFLSYMDATFSCCHSSMKLSSRLPLWRQASRIGLERVSQRAQPIICCSLISYRISPRMASSIFL
jgi:hypothetical protein